MSEEKIGIRIDPELRLRIMEEVGEGKQYRRITDFVLAAIEEKLDPSRRNNDIKEKIRSALQEDPSLLDDSLRRIGIRFYARKSDD